VSTNGVDCEGCHGPAGGWGQGHLALSWAALTPGAKAASGMRDLSGSAARAGACVACHVGDRSRGMNVNHDLIAAGHPRLNFEYASSLAALPKHWREPHEAGREPAGDFEARSWAVGQAVTADPSPRAGRGPRAIGPGRLPWATWPSAMLPAPAKGRAEVDSSVAGSPWAMLRSEMSRTEPDAKAVADLARRGVRGLDAWVADLERGPAADAAPGRALKDLGGGPPGPEAARLLETAPNLLAFPPNYDSPREGRPAPAGGR